jgi:hypothetical protein
VIRLDNKEKRIALMRELIITYFNPKTAYAVTSYDMAKVIIEKIDEIDELRIVEPVK